MSERAPTIIEDNGHEEFADVEDFIDSIGIDAAELGDEYKRLFPEDYVVAILGHRRSGKTSLMAHYLLRGLLNGLPVYTNLELYPERLNHTIQDMQKPLKLDSLLSFNPAMSEAVIGIEEIGTWMEAMRAQSTTNILLSKFFQLFIGKQGLRIFFTNQSTHLPYWIWEQVDMVIQAHDLFYTEWGRESNLAKGTSFFYVAIDRSGIFTGHARTIWTFGLRQANQLWNKFNSYQQFDPYQWARKTRIVGEDMIYDMHERRMYTPEAYNMEIEQEQIRQFNILLKGEYRSWGNRFIKLAQDNNAVLEQEPNRWRISLHQIQKTMANLKGKQRKQADRCFDKLEKLAVNSSGYLANIDRGQDIIYLLKPITEAQ